MNLDMFFRAKRIAIIGAAREEGKIGNVIFQNMLVQDFKGELFPVNPNADEILGHTCYKSLKDIFASLECRFFAVVNI